MNALELVVTIAVLVLAGTAPLLVVFCFAVADWCRRNPAAGFPSPWGLVRQWLQAPPPANEIEAQARLRRGRWRCRLGWHVPGIVFGWQPGTLCLHMRCMRCGKSHGGLYLSAEYILQNTAGRQQTGQAPPGERMN